MLKSLQDNLSLQSDTFRYATRLTISCTLVVILYVLFHFQNGYWAAFSVIACVFPTQGVSLYRAKHRMIGTFLGMWFGIILAHTVGSHFIIIDILITFFLFLAFYSKYFSYGAFATFNTILAVLFICLIYPGDWQIAVVRLIMTALGAIIAVIVTLFILPTYASKEYHNQLTAIKQFLAEYYDSIFSQTETSYSIQLSLFKQLQAAKNTLQESSWEYGGLPISHHAYHNLEHIYRTLLVLKIHYLPEIDNDAELSQLDQAIQLIIPKISPLFINYNAEAASQLINELINMRARLIEMRSNATMQREIPTASHFQRMQMNLFIDSLLKLLHYLQINRNQ